MGTVSRFNLRQKPRISYYEPDEPNLDEYVFCDDCGDYVYEYCSVHGHLLVIPDDKVPAKPEFPSFVPRAALTIPHVFLHLARSDIEDAGIGVFATLTLPRGVRFGPYRGDRSTEPDSAYCWQIYDANNRRSHVIDAGDANRSNWLRYVNCARKYSEQNLVAYQYQGQLYYRTIKIIPRFTELLVFYGSEFASFLDIDLKQYNSKKRYETIGCTVAKKPKIDGNDEPEEHGDENTTETNEAKTCEDKKPAQSEPEKKSLSNNKTNVSKIIRKKPKFVNPKKDICEKRSTYKNVNSTKAKNGDCIKQTNSKDQGKDEPKSNSSIEPENINFNKNNLDAVIKMREKFSHSCHRCNYITNKPKALETHLKIHDNAKKKSCPHCPYITLRSQKLNLHLLTHTGEKPFKCDICSYTCNRKSHLKSHIATHTVEKSFKCYICSYSCIYKCDLKRHIATHTGEKPFKCDICSYSCILKCNLKRHIATHTGEKPFKCDICSYSCILKCNLKRHIATHTGEKPFKCDICSYSCIQKISLKRHMATHTGEKPFKCDICSYSCIQKSSLKRHMSKHSSLK